MPRKPKPTTPFADLARSLAMTALYLNQLTVPAGLTPPFSPSAWWNDDAGALDVRAYIAPDHRLYADQEQQIDAMRAWAGALDGAFELAELRATTASVTGWARTLHVLAPLPDGAQLDLFTMLDMPAPTADPVGSEQRADLVGAAR